MTTYDFVDSGDVGSVSPELVEPAKPARRMLQPTKDEIRAELAAEKQTRANDRRKFLAAYALALAVFAADLAIHVANGLLP